jgi:hypothetical protein
MIKDRGPELRARAVQRGQKVGRFVREPKLAVTITRQSATTSGFVCNAVKSGKVRKSPASFP